MARPLRIDIEDGLYHVTTRGLERRQIVLDDYDRQKWFSLLDQVANRRNWRVLAWVMMDNHFHLFLRTPHSDLSAGMHDLNSGYVTVFNRRHKRCGPLFQGRFKAILVEQEHHDWELSRYIHLNPVRAGLVKRPELYPWSSCKAYFESRIAPDWLAWEEVLQNHGKTLRSARQAYLKFLIESIFSPPSSPLEGVVASLLLGSSTFVERMKTWVQKQLPDRNVPAAKLLRKKISLEEVTSAVCNTFGVPAHSIRCRGNHTNHARSVAVYLSRMLTQTPIEIIGRHFGGVKGSAISHIVHKIDRQKNQDKKLQSKLTEIEKQLKNN